MNDSKLKRWCSLFRRLVVCKASKTMYEIIGVGDNNIYMMDYHEISCFGSDERGFVSFETKVIPSVDSNDAKHRTFTLPMDSLNRFDVLLEELEEECSKFEDMVSRFKQFSSQAEEVFSIQETVEYSSVDAFELFERFICDNHNKTLHDVFGGDRFRDVAVGTELICQVPFRVIRDGYRPETCAMVIGNVLSWGSNDSIFLSGFRVYNNTAKRWEIINIEDYINNEQ